LWDGMDTSLRCVMDAQERLDAVNDTFAKRAADLEREGRHQRAPLLRERGVAAKRIPGFWMCALQGHPLLEQYISARDASILEHLTALEVSALSDTDAGFTITLSFSANRFFTNPILEKTLRYAGDAALSMEATPIAWTAASSGGGEEEAPHGEAATFLTAFAWTNGDTKCLLSGTGQAESAGLAEAEAFCEAIKEDVYAHPLRFFERFSCSEGAGDPTAA